MYTLSFILMGYSIGFAITYIILSFTKDYGRFPDEDKVIDSMVWPIVWYIGIKTTIKQIIQQYKHN